jgi:dephospho-CoA kinase
VRHVALIGAHGSGKSTAGQLMSEMGYQHWSIGDIRRLIRSGGSTAGIPPPVIAAVRRARPGDPLAASAASLLFSTAQGLSLCVVDGLPDGSAHVALLPVDWAVVHVVVPDALRQERLRARAATTDRQWFTGIESQRDLRIEETLSALPPHQVRTVLNDGSMNHLRDQLCAALRVEACEGQLSA